MNLKMRVKRVCNALWHLRPCNDIYMFHHVTTTPTVELSLMLDTQAFCRFLDKCRRVVPLEQLLEEQTGSGLCALTFDDGLEDVYTVAYPILKERGLPFTVFVTSGFVDKPGYLTREQLLRLAMDPLCTIGSHGTAHRLLPEIGEEAQREEIFQSKQQLEALIGREVGIYAYSHGAYTGEILELMPQAGYRYACVVAGRPVSRPFYKGKYAYPRHSVEEATREMFGI